MPFTTPSTSSATADASSPGSGRAQEPTSTQAAKKEHAMGASSGNPTTTSTTSLPNTCRPRRHEPAASSSSSSSSSSSGSRPVPHASDAHHHHRSLRLHVGVFSKRKGVRYNADGRVVKCRFCEILRDCDEPFLYEDELLVVFRPLHPIVPSHILIVPRAHIRNVNQLDVDHVALLRRMRAIADRVLHTHPELQSNQPQGSTSSEEEPETSRPKQLCPKSPNDVCAAVDEEYPGLTETTDETPSDADCRFAFHVPPFNSIDHVHMHAFRGDTGYFGRIKYRTESWWCRSYDEVLARLELQQQQQQLTGSRRLYTERAHAASTAPPAAPVVCS